MRVNGECARMLNRLVMALKISSGKCLWALNRERIERRLRAAWNSIKQIISDCNSTEFFSPLSNSSQIIFASSCSRFNPLISLQIQRSLSLETFAYFMRLPLLFFAKWNECMKDFKLERRDSAENFRALQSFARRRCFLRAFAPPSTLCECAPAIPNKNLLFRREWMRFPPRERDQGQTKNKKTVCIVAVSRNK